MLSEQNGMPEKRLQQIEVNQATADYGGIKGLAKALNMPERELLEVAGYVRPESR
jgi:hypothetical protein